VLKTLRIRKQEEVVYVTASADQWETKNIPNILLSSNVEVELGEIKEEQKKSSDTKDQSNEDELASQIKD